MHKNRRPWALEEGSKATGQNIAVFSSQSMQKVWGFLIHRWMLLERKKVEIDGQRQVSKKVDQCCKRYRTIVKAGKRRRMRKITFTTRLWGDAGGTVMSTEQQSLSIFHTSPSATNWKMLQLWATPYYSSRAGLWRSISMKRQGPDQGQRWSLPQPTSERHGLDIFQLVVRVLRTLSIHDLGSNTGLLALTPPALPHQLPLGECHGYRSSPRWSTAAT